MGITFDVSNCIWNKDLEDVFSKDDYLKMFNATFAGDFNQIKIPDLDASLDTIIKQINKIINKKKKRKRKKEKEKNKRITISKTKKRKTNN